MSINIKLQLSNKPNKAHLHKLSESSKNKPHHHKHTMVAMVAMVANNHKYTFFNSNHKVSSIWLHENEY